VDSFEYRNTIRHFVFSKKDDQLLTELSAITLKCWKVFNLHGYARVDFRVDEDGKPWVLEINANPCISPDSGFVAAAGQAGLNFETVVRHIINDIPGFKHDPEN
jgi:D-alanine-D-alanine ligase